MEAFRLKSYEFRREREAVWSELEVLINKAERQGMGSLTESELSRLPVLYRATISSLSVARSISLDRALLSYLETLAGRAYCYVYGARRQTLETALAFLTTGFPRALRRHLKAIAVSATLFVLATLTGLVLTLENPDRFYSFVDSNMAGGRDPSASTEYLRGTLYDESDEGGELSAFSSMLFANNARIGILCFALGFAFGLPVFVLLFTNGLMLGAMSAVFHSRGLAVDWWGWLLPHGVTELGAIILCGGAGLVLGQSLIVPGRYTRLENLALKGRQAGLIAVGGVVMFFAAALIEGIFRQTVTDIGIRYAVVLVSVLFWAFYIALAGRRDES